MMRIQSLRPQGIRAISSAIGTTILVIAWILFAPIQVGGLASYVIVIGSSMEPNFHIGDLVIVHQQPRYHVGEAVVYRNRDLSSFVFHRIIAGEHDRFSLQGDNNAWVDHYQPTKEEVLGKLWLHIPGGGTLLQKVRNPFAMTLLAAVLGYFISSSFLGNKIKGNKRMNHKSFRESLDSVKQRLRIWLTQINSPEYQSSPNINQGSILEGSFFVLGLVALLSIFLGIISFSRPTSRPASNDLPYQHLGIFSYLASAPQGIYDSNAIKSGDPVFPAITCVVDVNLQYTLIAQEARNITGTYQLTAVLREKVSGWQREIPLQEEASFSGTTFGTTTKLDLCRLESLVASMEQETGFHPGSYTISVTPNVHLTGTLLGNPLETTFDRGFIFLYDRVHFYLPQAEETKSPLSVTESDVIASSQTEANTVVFLGNRLPIPMLRWIAVAGVLGSLIGFVFLGLKLQSLSHTDQGQFFRVKYDSLIVDIDDVGYFAVQNCIQVMSMDALAKLAERFNAMILHVKRDDSHEYYVQAGEVCYMYRLPDKNTGSAVAAQDAVDAGAAQ